MKDWRHFKYPTEGTQKGPFGEVRFVNERRGAILMGVKELGREILLVRSVERVFVRRFVVPH